MIKQFLSFEWKQFFRSSNWQKSVALNILLVFFALYMMVSFLALGLVLYPMLKELYPESDPFIIINGYLFYWIMADLMMRFFLQKLPVMSVKPLLTLPVKRKTIINYVLRKSAFSFFNFLPFFAIIPFSIMLLIHDYNTIEVAVWFLVMVIITLIINYINFIIESYSSQIELSFLPIIAFVGGLVGLNHFGIISFSDLISKAILSIVNNPVYILVLLLVLIALYMLNYNQLKQKLYIDNSLKTKTSQAKETNLEWTKRFGDISAFLQLDIKLISRNKRAKSSIWILLIGLLYGLFFYPQPMYRDFEPLYIFIGIFVTGIFLINFGQFIPAWDSAYYRLLMSQNIKYEKYLKSKFTLMAASVIIMFLLSIPYVYFGWKILLAHFAAAVYNMGVNTHVVLYAGSYNRKKINLDERAAFNWQGTGAVQWLLGIPLMLLPMALFGILFWIFNFEVATIVVASLGILGIVFHHKLMKHIVSKYYESKYKMIDAFSQDN
ncbi:MAG: hypothetical protein HKO92_04920 [Flavobacteriaceae bacterium]|nr:hypothetical protein [Flavobacteriaceae bacterium]